MIGKRAPGINWAALTREDGTIDVLKLVHVSRPDFMEDPATHALLVEVAGLLDRELPAGGITSQETAMVAGLLLTLTCSIINSIEELPALIGRGVFDVLEDTVSVEYKAERDPKAH